LALVGIILVIIFESSVKYPSSIDTTFSTTNTVLKSIEVILAIVVLILSLIKIYFYIKEKEIIRFAVVILNIINLILVILAILDNCPPILITAFYLLLLIAEILSFFVGKSFYKKIFIISRKKISNTTFSIVFIILYLALVVVGIVRLALFENKGISITT